MAAFGSYLISPAIPFPFPVLLTMTPPSQDATTLAFIVKAHFSPTPPKYYIRNQNIVKSIANNRHRCCTALAFAVTQLTTISRLSPRERNLYIAQCTFVIAYLARRWAAQLFTYICSNFKASSKRILSSISDLLYVVQRLQITNR